MTDLNIKRANIPQRVEVRQFKRADVEEGSSFNSGLKKSNDTNLKEVKSMLPDEKYLEFSVEEIDLRFRVRLLTKENPDVVAQVLEQLPLQSVFGHVVISGEAIWIPTRIVHLGKSNMVKRSPGAVYLYAPGQTICLTYGAITESALVNKFGEVIEEDLPMLQKLGQYVWENTVVQARKNVVRVKVKQGE